MIMSWYTRNLSTKRFYNFNFLWLCNFYLTNFTCFFVSLTWRKQNRKQQHGGRLKLIKESVIILSLSSLLYITAFLVYLTSEFAPDSTMWFCPPSQLIAVDANLDIHQFSFYNHYLLFASLVYYEWLVQVEEIQKKKFGFRQN